MLFSGTVRGISWLKKDYRFYTLDYTTEDSTSIGAYQKLIEVGINQVEKFFGAGIKIDLKYSFIRIGNLWIAHGKMIGKSRVLNQNVGWWPVASLGKLIFFLHGYGYPIM